MDKEKKKPVILYLEKITQEMLEDYSYLTKRNRTNICNEAIKEYLKCKLKTELKKEGLVQ